MIHGKCTVPKCYVQQQKILFSDMVKNSRDDIQFVKGMQCKKIKEWYVNLKYRPTFLDCQLIYIPFGVNVEYRYVKISVTYEDKISYINFV